MTGRARQGPEPPGGTRGEAVPRAFPVARTAGRGLDRDAVAELTQLALGEATGPAGTRALFQDVVEPLCDVFDPGAAADYERAFAQVIQLARRDPRLGDLDRELDALGLGDEDALLARSAEGTSLEPLVEPGRLRLLLVPSRVTLGADVAVTRLVLDGALSACPRAEAVLLGPRASAMILRGRPRARHMGVGYGRGGLLAERLGAWTELRQAVRALTAGLGPRDWLLLDPDSRLTQLGLLVPAPAERHRRFPSRTLGSDGGATLGRLARDWTARVLGAAAGSELELEQGAAAWARAARGHGAPVIAVSFGTGGNARKRVADPFERGLLAWLCGQGWRVLLARGAAPEEVDATRRLCAGLERRGLAVAHLPPGRGAAEPGRADVVTWEGDADAFRRRHRHGRRLSGLRLRRPAHRGPHWGCRSSASSWRPTGPATAGAGRPRGPAPPRWSASRPIPTRARPWRASRRRAVGPGPDPPARARALGRGPLGGRGRGAAQLGLTRPPRPARAPTRPDGRSAGVSPPPGSRRASRPPRCRARPRRRWHGSAPRRAGPWRRACGARSPPSRRG